MNTSNSVAYGWGAFFCAVMGGAGLGYMQAQANNEVILKKAAERQKVLDAEREDMVARIVKNQRDRAGPRATSPARGLAPVDAWVLPKWLLPCPSPPSWPGEIGS